MGGADGAGAVPGISRPETPEAGPAGAAGRAVAPAVGPAACGRATGCPEVADSTGFEAPAGTGALSRGLGATGAAAAGAALGAAADVGTGLPAGGWFTSSRILSTIGGSRLASALAFTSSPHFWICSSNSWLFKPSSLASS
jgi:hypothetical protein